MIFICFQSGLDKTAESQLLRTSSVRFKVRNTIWSAFESDI